MHREIAPFFTNLKHPLSIDEQNDLIAKMKDGDMVAREKLIEHNLRFVLKIVCRYANTREEIEDYFSIGVIGLTKAVDTFSNDLSNSARLITYAGVCIKNEILMYLRKPVKKYTSFEDYIADGKPDELEIKFEQVLDSKEVLPIDAIAKQEKYFDLHNALHILDNRELQIIKLYYGLGNLKELKDADLYSACFGTCNVSKNEKEIADILQISRSYVCRIKTLALKKLYNYLKDKYQTNDQIFY